MISTKTFYYFLCVVVWAVCLAIYLALWHYEVSPSSGPDYGFAVLMFSRSFAQRIAARACQLLGVSQESTIVERFERVAGTHPNFITEPLYYPGVEKSHKKLVFLSVGLFGLAFGILTMLWLLDPTDGQTKVGMVSLPLALLFCVVLLGIFVVGSRAAQALADEQGVYVQNSFVQKTLVRWPEIQQMEIETKHNVVGDLASVTVSLHDSAGKEQKMKFLPAYPAAMRHELVHMITTNANLQQVSSQSTEQF